MQNLNHSNNTATADCGDRTDANIAPILEAMFGRTLSCTNVIESAFSIVETVCRNERWRSGDQIERWVGSGLLIAERHGVSAASPPAL
jgi:hypothetical protein